jgi:hypothetical protein
MYLCGRGIYFVYFYDVSIGFWNCSDNVVIFVFHFALCWGWDLIYIYLCSQWLSQKNTTTCANGKNPGRGLGQALKRGSVYQFMGSQHYPFFIEESSRAIQIWTNNKRKKSLLKNSTHTITKTNHNINIGRLLTKNGPSWLWSYGSRIYSYLCNQCLSPLTLWVRTPLRRGVLDTTLCDKVCRWLATGHCFSLGPPGSSTNKNDHRYNWNSVESGVKHHKPEPINMGWLLTKRFWNSRKIVKSHV